MTFAAAYTFAKPLKNITTVLLDQNSLGPQLDFSPFETLPLDWKSFKQSTTKETLQRIQNAEIIISNKVVLSRKTLQQAKQLKLICIAATGCNNVDLQAATDMGITVCNVKDYSTASVVQHVFAVLLALTTQQAAHQQAVQEGKWQTSPFFCLFEQPIYELGGKTLGIVGYGTLGKAVAHVASAFGMKVLLAQRPDSSSAQPNRLPLHQLLPQVDVLSLHCPLTPVTQNLIGTNELALMKPSALLINTARGGIVDEHALATALQNGTLAGAAIDVLSQEPPGNRNPLLQKNNPNLILTPHVAWASVESRQRLLQQLAQNIAAFLNGTPRNVVTP
ncbi:MAG: 2-hydroxyacid dehydrogenase [Gammaproteobacteria bacterium]|nr:2-hydroxyacid dehydrogenase [Gammaproteobacteria bacterium]